MAEKLELLLEAERRGLLPPDRKEALDEARKRGLVPGGAAPAPEPGLWDRAKIMGREAFEQSGTGTVMRRVQSGQLALDTANDVDAALGALSRGESVPQTSPYAGMPVEQLQSMRDQALVSGGKRRDAWLPREKQRRAELEALPSFADDPSLVGKAVKGAVNIGAMLVGGAPSPENLIPVTRGATLGQTFRRGAGVNAAVNVPVDVAAQAQDTQLGLQEGFDPARTAIAAALGGAIGGGVNVVPHAVSRMRAPKPSMGEMLGAPRVEPVLEPAARAVDSTPPVVERTMPEAAAPQVRTPEQALAPERAQAEPPILPDGTRPSPREWELMQAWEAHRVAEARDAALTGRDDPMHTQIGRDPAQDGNVQEPATFTPREQQQIANVQDSPQSTIRGQTSDVPLASKVSEGVESQVPVARSVSAGSLPPHITGEPALRTGHPPNKAVQGGAKEAGDFKSPAVQVNEPAAAASTVARTTDAPQPSAVGGARLPLQDAQSMPATFLKTAPNRSEATTPSIPLHNRDPGNMFGELADTARATADAQRAFFASKGYEQPSDVPLDKRAALEDEWMTSPQRAALESRNAQSHAPHQEVRRGPEPGDRANGDPQRGAGEARGRDEKTIVDEGGGDVRGRQDTAPSEKAPGLDEGGGQGRGEGEQGQARQTGQEEKVSAARQLSELRDRKPRPLHKLYGQRGLTPEQAAAHADAMRQWSREHRRLTKAHKEELESGNREFHEQQKRGARNDAPRAQDTAGGNGGEATPSPRGADGQAPGARDVGDDSRVDDAGAADGRAADPGLSSTLYANPIGKALSWGFGDAKAWGDSIKGLAEQVRKLRTKRDPDAGRPVRENWIRAILDSSSADIRAKVAQTKSDTARWIIDQFHQEAGGGRATGETFESSMHAWVNQHLVRLDKAFKGLNEADMKQAVRQVTAGNPVTKAAKAINDALSDALDYMRAQGVDVGEIKGGYFPRQFDSRMVASRPKTEFVDAAAREYEAQGMSPADAIKASDGLYTTLVFGEQSSIFTGGKGSGPAPFLKGRVFGKAVDDPAHPLHRFLERDPLIALPRYLMAAAKRAEIAKRFGDNFSKWDELTQKITKEGGGNVLDGLRDYVSMAAGLQGSGMSSRATRASSWMRTWGAFMFLEKATLSSLTEFIVPALRSGNMLDIGRSLKNTLSDLVWKTQGAAERRAFAEDLGLISGHLSDGIMAQRWAGGDPVSAIESRLLQNYFRRIGLAQWTDATQVAAANLSQVFIRRLALDFDGGGKLVKRQLADLGVPDGEQAAFVAFVKSKGNGLPTAADLQGPMGDLYARAVRTFTHQSIMMPSSTHRPAYMHNPIGKVIGQLQAFNYAFWENVWKRNARMAKEAVVGEGYTAAERAQLMAPMMTIPMLWAAAYAVGEGRDALLGDPNHRREETGGQKALKAAGRGAPIAPLDPIVNYATSARYKTDALKFAAGPVVGTAAGGADAMRDVLLNNSDKTNTAERKASRALYDLAVEPTVNFALGLTPVAPVSAAVTQAVGSGQVREKFVSGLAGERPAKGGSTGRDSGRRDSGRDSGR